jgi:hypothetical protein
LVAVPDDPSRDGFAGLAARCPPMTRPLTASQDWLSIRYDARFADGREEHGVDLNAVLQGSRFPADCWSTKNGARDACPDEGTGA